MKVGKKKSRLWEEVKGDTEQNKDDAIKAMGKHPGVIATTSMSLGPDDPAPEVKRNKSISDLLNRISDLTSAPARKG